MIKFDFKNTIENFDKKRIEEAQDVYKNIRSVMLEKHIENGWINKYVMSDYNMDDMMEVVKKAKEIKDTASTLIILCSTTTMYSLKAVIDPLKNSVSEILFLGDSLSASNLFYVLDRIKDSSVYLYVISDDLKRPEIGSHFRVIFNWFRKKYITDIDDRIMIATREDSDLIEIANQLELVYTTYEEDFPLEYIAYHPVAYLPLFVAGIDIREIKRGANVMIRSFLDNEEFFRDYVVIRWVALQEGIESENVCSFDPRLENFCIWRSKLKGNDMIYHGSALFIRDTDNFKYYHKEYKSKIMETMIDVTVPNIDIVVKPIDGVNDGLSYLDNMGFNQLNYAEYQKVIKQHENEGMNINEIKCGMMNCEVLGALSFFFILSGLGVNEIIEINKTV